MADDPTHERAQRQSLNGQDPPNPYLVDTLARATTHGPWGDRSLATPRGAPQDSAGDSTPDDGGPEPALQRPTVRDDDGAELKQAAAQLEDSARRTVARWAGDQRVISLVAQTRPLFRGALDELAIDDPGDRCEAAARLLGIAPVLPNGAEEPNPFAAWPEDRLGPARDAASRVRAGLAELVDRLRADGVASLGPVEHGPTTLETPDGLEFGFDHVALLSLLWLDIPVEGRSGSQIAEALPMLGTVGWERDRNALLVGAASQPDILAGDTLRRAFERQAGDGGATLEGSNPSGVLPFSDALRDYLEANPPSAADMYPQYRRARRKRKPHPGRPRGTRYLVRSVVLRASQDLSADAATDSLRTRDGRVRRYVTMQDLADKVDAPISTLKDFLRANNLNWQERSGWPRE